MNAETKFKIVAYVRCDENANDGIAMSCGVFEQSSRTFAFRKNLYIAQIAGSGYQKVEFDPVALTPAMFIWFSPQRRDNEVTPIYVDRVLIKRQLP